MWLGYVRSGLVRLKINAFATSIKTKSVNHTEQILHIRKICKSPPSSVTLLKTENRLIFKF